MNRREHLEHKVEKRRAWSTKAKVRAEAAFAVAAKIANAIPLGQPILLNHHSEKRARRDADRIHSNMSKGVEKEKLADHHASKASGLEIQLERSVFSDDANAVEQIEARIAEKRGAA